jgi:hypothetical protein
VMNNGIFCHRGLARKLGIYGQLLPIMLKRLPLSMWCPLMAAPWEVSLLSWSDELLLLLLLLLSAGVKMPPLDNDVWK